MQIQKKGAEKTENTVPLQLPNFAEVFLQPPFSQYRRQCGRHFTITPNKATETQEEGNVTVS